jgi:putative endonuclease
MGDGWSRKCIKMYHVYILKSWVSEKFYIGYTNDLEQRLRKHNSGSNKSTRPYRPWTIVYKQNFVDKNSAWLRERQRQS